MKTFWAVQTRRINAMSLRERAIMFVSLSVALVAVADAVVLSPRFAEQKALAQQMRLQTQDLQAMRASLAGAGDADAATPQGRMLQQLREMQAQREALDAEIARRGSGGGTRLPDLLERVLRRHDGLTLLRLDTSATAPASARPGAPPLRGVQIALRGDYADLVRYVADTEAALPGLRWGAVAVTRDSGATELSAQVFLTGEPR